MKLASLSILFLMYSSTSFCQSNYCEEADVLGAKDIYKFTDGSHIALLDQEKHKSSFMTDKNNTTIIEYKPSLLEEVVGIRKNTIVIRRNGDDSVAEIETDSYGGYLSKFLQHAPAVVPSAEADDTGSGRSVKLSKDLNGKCYISKIDYLTFSDKMPVKRESLYDYSSCRLAYDFQKTEKINLLDCKVMTTVDDFGRVSYSSSNCKNIEPKAKDFVIKNKLATPTDRHPAVLLLSGLVSQCNLLHANEVVLPGPNQTSSHHIEK